MPGLFAFFVSLTALATLIAMVGYPLAALRGTGVGIARFAPWIALAAAALAVAISPIVDTDDSSVPTDARSMSWGIAAAGGLVSFSMIARDISNLSEFGTLQVFVLLVSIGVMVGSAFLARKLVEYDAAHQVAVIMIRTASSGAETSSSETRRYRLLAFVTGTVVLVVGLGVVLATGPLGHDESIYALKARSWHLGTPTTGFADYRPIGMPIVGWVVLLFSDSEMAFRLAGIGLSVGAVLAMWTTGRIVFSTSAAWLGTAVFVSSASFLRRSTEFLNDLAAAGLLIATVLVVWYHFERRPDEWWLLGAAPLAAGAYYMRYGSALGLAIIALFSILVWHRTLTHSWRQIIVAAGAGLLLLSPHLIYSLDLTGSVLGVFQSASTSVGGGGGGIGHYVSWLPEQLAGRLGAALMASGIIYAGVAVIKAIRSDADRNRWGEARTMIFLAGIATSLTLALGAFTHGEPRFVFMPLMVTLLMGGHAVANIGDHLKRIPLRFISATLALVVLLAFSSGVLHMSRSMDGITGSRTVIADAAGAVRSDAGDQHCSVHSSYVPQMTWYAVCETHSFREPRPTLSPTYLVVFANGKRQPTASELRKEIAAADAEQIAVVEDGYDKIGTGLVFRYP